MDGSEGYALSGASIARSSFAENDAPMRLNLAPLYPHLEVCVHAFENVKNAREILSLLLPSSDQPKQKKEEGAEVAEFPECCPCDDGPSCKENPACVLGLGASDADAKEPLEAKEQRRVVPGKGENSRSLHWSLRPCVWFCRRVFGVFCCNGEFLLSLQQLQVALLAAVDAVYRRRTRTKTFFSEVLFRLAPHKNISLALQQYGVNAETRKMFVVAFEDTREAGSGGSLCLNRKSPLEQMSLEKDMPVAEAPLKKAREDVSRLLSQRLLNRARLAVVGTEVHVDPLWLCDVKLTNDERRSREEEKASLLQKHFGVSAEEARLPGGLHAAVIGRIATKMI